MNDPPIAAPPDSGLTALSMLERVRAADPEAWRRLVHLYSPLIYSWCRRADFGSEDAADLMQDVWSAVSVNIGRFERSSEYGSFRGWLWTITRNKLRDFWRSRVGRAAGVGGSEAQQRLSMIPDHEPLDDSESESSNLMHRALDMIRGDFEPRTWGAFWRTAVDGESAAQAGAKLGLSIDAVYQAKSRVLRRLREELQGLAH
jgi:RNA polymerase sigma factor (sigma-70 family)